jgi:3-dehydroquinate synthase
VSGVIAACGLPSRLEEMGGRRYSAAALVARMGQDKKARNGALTFVLARAIGDAFLAENVDQRAVAEFLVGEGANP